MSLDRYDRGREPCLWGRLLAKPEQHLEMVMNMSLGVPGHQMV